VLYTALSLVAMPLTFAKLDDFTQAAIYPTSSDLFMTPEAQASFPDRSP
jgi:hypothetical protein